MVLRVDHEQYVTEIFDDAHRPMLSFDAGVLVGTTIYYSYGWCWVRVTWGIDGQNMTRGNSRSICCNLPRTGGSFS